MSASHPRELALPMPSGLDEPVPRAEARARIARQNWPFLAFVATIPLQNLYSSYLPNFGGGLNYLNLMLVASLLGAWACGGRLVRGTGINGWVLVYAAMSLLALLVGFGTVADAAAHVNILKDQLIAIGFVFLAQMSARDEASVRRLLLASLLPLPYMASVVLAQHRSVSSWHYSHDLRISGTFSDLGANEFAAFSVTALLVSLALLLGVRAGWRWRTAFAAAAAAATLGVVLTYSRTAYVSVLVGVLLVLLLRRAGLRLLVPAALGLALLPSLLPPSVLERFDSIEIEEGRRDESTEHRFEFWQVAKQNIAAHPLLGTGFHTFHHAEVNPHRSDTHNFFLRELAEKGVLGGVVLFGLLWSIARLLRRAVRRTQPGSWTFGLALGLGAAFAALLCGNAFGDRFTHYPMIAHFWLYLGLLLRLVKLDADTPREAPDGQQ